METPYELWFRAPYQEDLIHKKISAAIRPGDRRFPLPKGARIDELAKIKIIVKPGVEKVNIPPVFNGFEMSVKITNLVVRTIGELKYNDLYRCSCDTQNAEAVKKHLSRIYGRNFEDKEIVTIIYWEYNKEDHA